jgi:hypothetical protein
VWVLGHSYYSTAVPIGTLLNYSGSVSLSPVVNLKGDVTVLLIVIVVGLVLLKLPQQSKTLQQTVALLFIDKIDNRDGIFNLFMSQGIDSKFHHSSVVTLMEYDRLYPENMNT